MKHRILNIALTLLSFQLYAADYYWVDGGGGNWSDLNHWRLGSSAAIDYQPMVPPGTRQKITIPANN